MTVVRFGDVAAKSVHQDIEANKLFFQHSVEMMNGIAFAYFVGVQLPKFIELLVPCGF
jgi:hypothetical protein